MPDLEKVIKGLECCVLQDPDDKKRCDDCPYRHPDGVITNSPCVNGLMGNALALLKAQEPVEPERAHSGGGSTWWNVCGSCKTAINPNDKFCHECGRAVKWDD